MKWFPCSLIVLLAVLHQDFWNWKSASLQFGFLPVGLTYHIAYALACAGLMALLVRYKWPKELESGSARDSRSAPRGGRS